MQVSPCGCQSATPFGPGRLLPPAGRLLRRPCGSTGWAERPVQVFSIVGTASENVYRQKKDLIFFSFLSRFETALAQLKSSAQALHQKNQPGNYSGLIPHSFGPDKPERLQVYNSVSSKLFLITTKKDSPLTIHQRLVYSYLVMREQPTSASKIVGYLSISWDSVRHALQVLRWYRLARKTKAGYVAHEPGKLASKSFTLRNPEATLKERFAYSLVVIGETGLNLHADCLLGLLRSYSRSKCSGRRLGTMLGIDHQTVCRTMKKLADKGFIEFKTGYSWTVKVEAALKKEKPTEPKPAAVAQPEKPDYLKLHHLIDADSILNDDDKKKCSCPFAHLWAKSWLRQGGCSEHGKHVRAALEGYLLGEDVRVEAYRCAYGCNSCKKVSQTLDVFTVQGHGRHDQYVCETDLIMMGGS